MFDRTVHHVYDGTVEVHYYFHGDAAQNDQLASISARLDLLWNAIQTSVASILQREEGMNVRLDELTAAVQRDTDAESSAITLLKSLAEEIRSLQPTQQAIDQLANQINAQAEMMAAAVVANTPAQDSGTTTTTPTPTPAPGSTPMGGGGAAEPPAQNPPSGGGGSETGGTTGATDTGAPGGTTEPTQPAP